MSEPLYNQIAESIRQMILSGAIQPGDRLPTVREMTLTWHCTTGTVQRAYRELARQGLVISRAGQGTRVTRSFERDTDTPIRKAALVHRAESFLLEVLTAGYSLAEIEQSFRMALERWRLIEETPSWSSYNTIRFVGSHDIAVDWLAANLKEILPDFLLQPTYTGSLGGLIALVEGNADLAGCHLWDQATDSYNVPFVKKLLPGKRVALITLAVRNLGLILPPGNPLQVKSLADLVNPSVQFINRQPGSGTRVWLDAQLHSLQIDPTKINGYSTTVGTHHEVARSIAENKANAGLGLEASAIAFGLDFIHLTQERYDLVILADRIQEQPFQKMISWLKKPGYRQAIQKLGGYDTSNSGDILWVE